MKRTIINPYDTFNSLCDKVISHNGYATKDEWALLVQSAHEMAIQAKEQAEVVRAYDRQRLDAYYIQRSVQAPRDGNVIDMREHLRKRHESH